MVAGRGVTHSERTSEAARKGPNGLFGIQTWLALPDAHEDVAPSFEHHGKDTLPMIEDRGVSALRDFLRSANIEPREVLLEEGSATSHVAIVARASVIAPPARVTPVTRPPAESIEATSAPNVPSTATGRMENSAVFPGSIVTRIQSYKAAPGPKQHSWLSRTSRPAPPAAGPGSPR